MASRVLTVLICTHNRVGLLGQTIASLGRSVPPVDWDVDILVAANACSDQTHALLEERKKQCDCGMLRLDWFVEPTPGKSYALNSALTRLRGDVVAFVDDDHRVDSAYIESICKAVAQNPDVDMFCGRILPDWDGSEPDWVHDTGPYRIYPLPVPRFDQGEISKPLPEGTAIPGGGNLVLRTRLFEHVGKFSVDLGPKGHNLAGSEDIDWVLRALRLGFTLRYEPSIVQYHYVDCDRLKLGYMMRKAFERSATSVRFERHTKGIPLYVYRKVVEYGAISLISLSWKRRRFYLVRLAAALGEWKGYFLSALDHWKWGRGRN